MDDIKEYVTHAYMAVVDKQAKLEWGSSAEVALDVVRRALHEALLRLEWAKQWTEDKDDTTASTETPG